MQFGQGESGKEVIIELKTVVGPWQALTISVGNPPVSSTYRRVSRGTGTEGDSCYPGTEPLKRGCPQKL
jgi:hypothetical protein